MERPNRSTRDPGHLEAVDGARVRVQYAAHMDEAYLARKPVPDRGPAPVLILIGVGKLVKAALMIAVGVAALDLLDKDATETLTRWVHQLRADPDNRFIHSLLERLTSLTQTQLKELGVGTFLYAALFLAEGVGLLLQKHWAEYLTVASTAVFLPLEVYEMTRHLTFVRGAVFVINIAIVVYLVARVRARARQKHHRP